MRIERTFCGARLAAIIAILAYCSLPASAQQLQPQGIKDLANQIAASVSKERKTSIAVVGFHELDGRSSALGAFLTEELTTQLFGVPGLEIVERTMLDRILAELKLAASGIIDPASARSVGKVAGVQAIVTGTITDLQSSIAINSRLIDAETGRVFAAAQTRIVKDDDIHKVMGASVREIVSDQPPRETTLVQRGGALGFTFELRVCRRSGGGVSCEFTVINERGDYALRLDNNSRAIDDAGSQYESSEQIVGNQFTREQFCAQFSCVGLLDRQISESMAWQRTQLSRRGVMLVSGVRTPATVTFENVTPTARRFSLLELSGFSRDWFTVQFRNVPLTE